MINLKKHTCKICGYISNKLGSHVNQSHDITPQEYYDKYILKDMSNKTCKLDGCSNNTSFVSISKGYLKYCSNSHAQLSPTVDMKKKNTRLLIYGSSNFTNREKARKTCLEKYHNEYYNNRDKCAQKLLNRNCEELNLWRDKIRDVWKNKSVSDKKRIIIKRNNTLNVKYGSISYPQLRHRESIKNKYNVNNVSQIKGFAEKVKNTWKRKSILELKNIQNKKEKTNIEKYGAPHIMLIPERKTDIIHKSIQTKVRKGIILSDAQVKPFELYKRKVAHFTYQSIKNNSSAISLIGLGKCGVCGALQIDHLYSIKRGFIDNVPPNIIGDICNLGVISWEENDKKKDKCSIKLSELYDKYGKE